MELKCLKEGFKFYCEWIYNILVIYVEQTGKV